MSTPEGIATTISYLVAVYGPPQAPIADLATAWHDALDDVADAALMAAARAHVRDPDHGQWWPRPADIIRRASAPTRDHAATLDAILGRIASGRYEVGDLLDDTERRALASIGGTWALRMADTERQLPRLRTQFLAACKGDPVARRAVEAREAFRALPGGRDGGR